MNSALHRRNEAASLQVLYDLDVLDSPCEPEFDMLAESAARVCKAPIALITLVDRHRQWFKANVGLKGIDQTDRDTSFCAHAVLKGGLFVVPDLLEDSRFAGNSLVSGAPGIRFYAGAPLRLPKQTFIGTICVMDRVARHLTPVQASALEQLADAVVQALQARACSNSLNSSLQASGESLAAQVQVKAALRHVDQATRHFRASQHLEGVPSAMAVPLDAACEISPNDEWTGKQRRQSQALHLCLTAAGVMLAAAHRLSGRQTVMTSRQRRLAWEQSASDVKMAADVSRRAGRVLSEPFVDMELVQGRGKNRPGLEGDQRS